MEQFDFDDEDGPVNVAPKAKSKESLKNVLSRKELDDHELFMIMNEYE